MEDLEVSMLSIPYYFTCGCIPSSTAYDESVRLVMGGGPIGAGGHDSPLLEAKGTGGIIRG